MPNLTEVHVTAGVPDSGTGTVSTLDALLAVVATQTTLAAILAKIIAAPATEAKQDTGNTSLASVDTKLTSTNSKLDTLHTDLGTTLAAYVDGLEALITTTNSKDFATQTTLAAVLAKIIAAPATEAKQDALIALVPASLGQKAASASFAMVPPSDRQNTSIFSLTLSLDTNAYASGDVLADTQQCDAFFNKTDGAGVIQSLTVIDEDDQGAAFTVYFFQANRSLGTENSAPNISDANARDCIGWVDVATSDYKDLGGVRVAHIRNIGLPVKAVSSTDDLYVGVVNGTGTPTYTASGIKLVFGALQD